MILKPHTWTLSIVGFIDGDADMNNSQGRKRIYTSAGMRATYLSSVRKRTRVWRLRVVVDRIWRPKPSEIHAFCTLFSVTKVSLNSKYSAHFQFLKNKEVGLWVHPAFCVSVWSRWEIPRLSDKTVVPLAATPTSNNKMAGARVRWAGATVAPFILVFWSDLW
jgi:hypothetical protein